MIIGYGAEICYWDGDKIVFKTVNKGEEMSEKKQYVVLYGSGTMKCRFDSKDEAEREAKVCAEKYSGRYYVAEIYAFYQRREPVQRVELT